MLFRLKYTTCLNKGVLLGCLAAGVIGLPPVALAVEDGALPSGGVVVGGSASMDYGTPQQLHIQQNSQRAVINWDSFNIGKNALTQFHQPGSGSIAVNRVVGPGQDPTQILGSLKANGKIMVLDRNGVFFGADSRVDVGGIVASTGDISTGDFMNGGEIVLHGIDTGGQIVNNGQINVSDAGLAAFVAPHVVNNGLIRADMGRVQLASGTQATVDFYGDGMIQLAVDENFTTALVENHGEIVANGGKVALTAGQAVGIVDNLINMDGSIDVSSVEGAGGVAVLEGGRVMIGGDIMAAGKTSGGQVEILGEQVALLTGAQVDASGEQAGGAVHMGGEYLGGGDTRRAKATVMQAGASIKANGGGGEVILWSDEYTNFAGVIEANGGGGFVETSSADILTATGDVYATGGQWLLDPGDITIQAAGPDTVPGNPIFDAAGAGGIVTVVSIQNALFGSDGTDGADVTVRTGSGGGGNGDIAVDSAILYTGAAERTLTLEAYRNIRVNGTSITSTTGELNLVFNSRYTDGATGFVAFLSSAIDTNGGDLLAAGGAGAAGYAIGSNDASGWSGVDIWDSVVETGIGTLTLRGQGGGDDSVSGVNIYGNSAIDTTSGSILIDGLGIANGNQPYGVRVDAASITTQTGEISITGQAGDSGDWDAQGVLLNNGAVIESTGGAGANRIYISGTAGTSVSGGSTGIYIVDSDIISNAANIEIDAYGGASAGDYNIGLMLEADSSIHSVSGNIDIYGEGGAGNSINPGIALNGFGSTAEIYSTSGNIRLEGVGGAGVASGIDISADSLVYTTTASAGFGNIELVGTGGTSGDYSAGVYMYSDGSTLNLVETNAGNITITGQGGAGGQYEIGVALNGQDGTVGILSVSGDINIAGTAGTGTVDIHGILMNNGYARTTSGDITMTGTTADNDSYGIYLQNGSDVLSTGAVTGDITLNAISSNFTDFRTGGATVTIGDTGGTDSQKNITINADEVEMANTSLDTTGTVTFNTRTQNRHIYLGGGTGGLDLSDTELAMVSNNVSGLVFRTTTDGGNSNGLVTIDSWDMTNKTFDLEVYGGEIDVNAITNAVNVGMVFEADNAANGNVNIDGLSITNNDATNRAFTVRAADTIDFSNGTIDASGGAGQLDMTFHANSDEDLDGAVNLYTSTITTNGGDFVVGGGGDPLAEAATAVGGDAVLFDTVDVSTGAGLISMRGLTTDGAAGWVSGIQLIDSYFLTTSGDITMSGISEDSGANGFGLWLNANGGGGTQIETTSGNITLTGEAVTGHGVMIWVGGGIDQTGTGVVGDIIINGATDNLAGAYGVNFSNNAYMDVADADVTINATGGSSFYSDDTISKSAGGAAGFTVNADDDIIFAAGGDMVSSSGVWNIVLNADADGDNSGTASISDIGIDTNGGSFSLSGADMVLTNSTVDTGAATILIQASTAARTVGVSGGAGDFGISDAELGMLDTTGILIIGDSTAATGLVTVDSWDFSGENYDVQIHGGSIIANGITPGTNALTLNARTSFVRVTQDIIDFVSATVTAVTDIIFNADSDGNNSGNIDLLNSSLISTGGGVYLVGGLDGNADNIGDGYAYGVGANGTGINISNTTITTAAGDMLMRGYGAPGGAGIIVTNGSLVTSTSGDMEMWAHGGDGAGGGYPVGMLLEGNSIIRSTGAGINAGNIYINATAGDDTDGDSYGGFNQWDGGLISSVDGDIEIVGSGGNAVGINNPGIYLQTLGSGGAIIETTGDGNIDLTGTGSTSAGATDSNYGILLESDFILRATGTGSINMTGTGGSNATGNNNSGLRIEGTVSAAGGSVTIDGTAGNGSSHGVHLANGAAVVETTGAGNLDVTGDASTTTAAGSHGILVENASIFRATGTGNVDLTGTGGGAGGGANKSGIYLDAGGAVNDIVQVSATSGTITLDGTANSGGINVYGVYINGDIETTTGDIYVTGRSSDDDSAGIRMSRGDIQATAAGAGDIVITAINDQAGVDDFVASDGTVNIGSGTSSKTITINADEVDYSSTSIDTQGDVIFTPRNGAQVISLGTAFGSAVGLDLSDTELTGIGANVANLIIGDSAAGTGAVSIDSWDASARTYNIEVHGGEITVDNGLTGGGTILLNARGGSDVIVNDVITAVGGGQSLVVNATGDFINNFGAGALDPGAGRFLVYSADVGTITYGGLTGDEIFDETYATLAPAAVPGVNDTFIFAGADPDAAPGPGPGPGPSPTPTPTPTPSSNSGLPGRTSVDGLIRYTSNYKGETETASKDNPVVSESGQDDIDAVDCLIVDIGAGSCYSQ